MTYPVSKVLLLTTPNVSIHKTVHFPNPYYGIMEVAGALEQDEFEVYHYDLNAALNSVRKDYKLSEATVELLLGEKKYMREIYYGTGNFGDLHVVLQELISLINSLKYDVIGVGLDDAWAGSGIERWWMYTYNFAILLVYELRKRFGNLPIFLGGKQTLRRVGDIYIRETITQGVPISAFFIEEAKWEFPRFLRSMPPLEDDVFMIFSRRGKKLQDKRRNSIKIPAKGEIENRSHLLYDVTEALPEPIKEKYPELRDIKPFNQIRFKLSFGCPYRCTFCTEASNKVFSFLKIQECVDILERFYDKGHENILMYDNNLNFQEDYVINLCNEIVKRNLKIKFSDSANLRIGSKEMFLALKDAGCVKLWFGAETANNRLLEVNRKELTSDILYENLNHANEAGIWNSLNLIVNFPHESEEEFQDTFNLVKSGLGDCISCNVFILHHPTDYRFKSEEYGIKLRELSDIDERGVFSFDEIGGITWEERVVQGQKRKDMCMMEIGYEENQILKSDPLMFGISQVVNEKSRKKEILNELIKLHREMDSSRPFSEELQ